MANVDIAIRLRTEIERVLSAKYAVGLTTMQQILEEDEQYVEVINDFAAANSCKLNGLVDAIRDQVELRSCVVDLVLRLSSSRLFTKALVERHPQLAAALIIQAAEDFRAYAQMGVNIIKFWPKQSISTLPIDADRFIARLVKSVNDGTSTVSLLDTHDCIGTSVDSLVPALSAKTIDSFLDHLSALIKQKLPAREHERVIGIASLYQFWRQQTTATIDRKGWEETATQLFRPEKIVQAMNLVIVDVFFVTKPNSSLSQLEMERTLIIAQQFLSHVGSCEIRSWCQLKSSPSYLEKLGIFSSADHLTLAVRWQLIGLLAVIYSVNNSMTCQVSVLNHNLNGLISSKSSIAVTADQYRNMFHVFGKHLSDQTMARLMQRAVQLLCMNVNEMPSNTDQHNFRSMIDGLRLVAADNIHLRKQIAQWLASTERSDVLTALKPTDVKVNCNGGTRCAVTAARCRNDLRACMSQLILEALALLNHADVPGLGSKFTLSMLRTIQLASASSIAPCTAWQVARGKSILLASNIVPCTPVDGHHARSWREQICSLVESDSRHRQDSLIHFFQDMCQDLEDRCENAEEPLRQERLRRGQTEKALAQTRATCDTLQSTLNECNVALADSEQRASDASEKLTVQLGEMTELHDQLQRLQTELAKTSADHQAEIKQLHSANTDVEASVARQLSEVQDELALCKRELQKEQGNADKLRQELDEKAPELRQAQKDVAEKEQRLACLEGQLVKSKAAITELQENAHTLFTARQASDRKTAEAESRCKILEMQVNSLKKESETEKRLHKMSLDSAAAEYEGKLQTHEIRYETCVQDHADAMIQTKAKHQQQKEHLESRIRQMQEKSEQKMNDMHDKISAQADELAQAHVAVSHLEQEIEELQGILEEKDNELNALQTLQANLQQVFASKPAAATRAKTLVRKRIEKTPTFKAPRAQTPAPDPAEQSFDDASSLMCTVPQALGQGVSHVSPTQPGSANSSFGSAPRAKRQRQKTPVKQAAFKIPMLRQTHQTAVSTATVGSPSKRVPLQDISRVRGNGMSPLRPKSNRRQSLRSSKKLRESMAKSKPLDDDAFEEMVSEDFGSEVFTGTQMSQSKLHALTAEQYNDGTTVDE